MRKYFTWRSIALHLITLVLVPSFLLAGWWQYHVAEGGNDLSWVYTVEWPAFSVYAIYMWWALIHDKRTPFDKLWAAKARVAADAEGTPLYQIPGWATDKELSRAVTQASYDAVKELTLSSAGSPGALRAPDHPGSRRPQGLPELAELSGMPELSDIPEPSDMPELLELSGTDRPAGSITPEPVEPATADGDAGAVIDAEVIDAEVVEVKVVVDEELDAYNRYLADLNWNGPEKRWGGAKRNRTAGRRSPGPGSGHRSPGPGSGHRSPGDRGVA